MNVTTLIPLSFKSSKFKWLTPAPKLATAFRRGINERRSLNQAALCTFVMAPVAKRMMIFKYKFIA